MAHATGRPTHLVSAIVSDIAICYAVLAGAVVLFVWNRFPVELVALGVALSLWATDVLTIDQSLGGFGETTVLFIASLFVVSEGLDSTGVTAWAGQQLIAKAGTSRVRLMVLTMSLVALLTALISVNGAVAALVPMVVVLAVRLGRSTSQLLMPVAFAAHAGSMLALTGTPVSVIVSDAAADAGFDRFGFFEFALVGVPLVIGTIAVVVLLGPKLLPDRSPKVISPDLSMLAPLLSQQYVLEGTVRRLTVQEGSAWAGLRRDQLDMACYPEVTLVGVQRVGALALDADTTIHVGDVIAVRGDRDTVAELATDVGLQQRSEVRAAGDDDHGLVGRDVGVSELVVPPRSELIGERVFPGMVSSTGDLVVLAVQRRGEPIMKEVEVAAGDVLLVRGTWLALEQNSGRPGRDGGRRTVDAAPSGGALRPRREARGRDPRSDGAAPGHRRSPRGRGRRGRSDGAGAHQRDDRAAGVPLDLVDHRVAGRRHDLVVGGDAGDRCGGRAGRPPRPHRRRRRALRPALPGCSCCQRRSASSSATWRRRSSSSRSRCRPRPSSTCRRGRC